MEIQLSTVADAAAALDHAQAQARAAEVATCLAIAALCDLHRVDEEVLFRGAERWVPGGGDGTPSIGEFVIGEIAGLLGVSPGAAVQRIATVLNLRHRHPALWRAMCGGTVRAWEAAMVAQACDAAGLDLAACLTVDRHCAVALAQQSWSRVRGQIDGWIIVADPRRAAERERAAARRRHVSFGDVADGHVPVWAQLDAADGLILDEALSALADALPHTDRDASRAAALGTLARHALGQEFLPLPGHAPTCEPIAPRRPVEVVVQLTPDERAGQPGESGEPAPLGRARHAAGRPVARVRGWGHVRTERLAEMFAGCKVTVRPVVDAAQLSPVDDYVVPAPIRLAMEARFPVDTFPFGTRPARSCDADHTIPYDDGAATGAGQTRLSNLAPLSRFTHRLKTHGGWRVEQPVAGVLIWTSPLGYRYLVTADGSTLIDRPPARETDWWRVEPPDPASAGPASPGTARPPADEDAQPPSEQQIVVVDRPLVRAAA